MEAVGVFLSGNAVRIAATRLTGAGQQTVYGVTNDYNALAINTVNHLECEVKNRQ